MNELTTAQQSLPAAIEELAKFVLVGREKLTSVRAEIRAIDKLNLAREVRDQKKDEARMMSEALMDAEVRLGELFKQIPKATNNGANQYQGASPTAVSEKQKTKAETVNDLGFSEKQAERFEILAENKEIVEQVKAEARENDDLPTRTRVLNLVAHQKKKDDEEHEPQEGRRAKIINAADRLREEEQAYYSQVDLRVKVYNELSSIVNKLYDFEVTPERMAALLTAYVGPVTIKEQIEYIDDSVEKLNQIKYELLKGGKTRDEKRRL